MIKKLDEYTKEELIDEIKSLKKRKSFGLVWENKPENVAIECAEKLPVIVEATDRAIFTASETDPTHLIIEGDNYHALSVLNYTHAGKIDVIYIDPPYNTGARDWLYNNDYVDNNDAYRHSKWISFMDKRLRLSKNLLKNTGVLICAIDENEISHLGVLLEEIFPGKAITPVTVVHNPSGIQGKNFANNNEFLFFVYDNSVKSIAQEVRSDDDADIRPFINGAKGNTNAYLRTSGNNSFYPILIKDEKVIGFGDVLPKDLHPESRVIKKDGYSEIYPIDNDGVERKWLFARNSVEQIKEDLSVKINSRTKEPTIIRTKKIINYKTVWISPEYNAKKYGTELVKNITKTDFPFPKSLYAVMESIKAVVHDKNNAIILDFFAGSGTTGHAVLELNKIDGGNRQFIICTNNENNIAEKVTYPRIKGVAEGYGEVPGIPANVRYFRTVFVEKNKTPDRLKRELSPRCEDMIRIREGNFNRIIDEEMFKVYKSASRLCAIVFDRWELAKYIDKLDAMDTDEPVHLYVFSYDKDDRHDEMPNNTKHEYQLQPIPEGVLEIYRKIFRGVAKGGVNND